MVKLRSRMFVLLLAFALIAAGCTAAGGGGQATEPPQETEAMEQPTEPPAEEATEPPAAEASPTEEPAETEPPAVATEPEAEGGLVPVDVPMIKDAVCRVEPKDSAGALGSILAGTTVTLRGKGVGTGWVAVEFPDSGGDVCWVRETSVGYDGDFALLPIYGRSEDIAPEDEPVELPEGTESEVIKDALCMEGPGGSYGTIRALLVGETVIVYGKGVGSGWYVVALPESGKSCWVSDQAVDFTGNVEDLKIIAAP